MLEHIFENPRFVATDRFRRQAKTLEWTDQADLQRVLVGLMADPEAGTRQSDGAYQLQFGSYVLRYSVLDPQEPQTRISLDAVETL